MKHAFRYLLWTAIQHEFSYLSELHMAKQEGVTEALKAADQMEWVCRMNNIRNRAEEIILTELVYA